MWKVKHPSGLSWKSPNGAAKKSRRN